MKKVYSALIVSGVLSVLASASANAKPLAQEGGWEFTISLNAGFVSGQSNLSTSDDNELVTDLESEAETSSSFIGFPFARIQYTTDDLKTQIFLGNSRDQISTSQFQYELGVIHQFENKSQLTVAYFPELPLFNETWEDPYLVGQTRIKTDDNAQGGRIELSRIAGGPITLKYAYARSKVDNDNSGESWSDNGNQLSASQLQSLQRSSQYHRVAVETMFPVYLALPKVFLKPTLQYTTRIADGEAMSYDDYNFQLGLLVFAGRHTSITTFNIGSTAYDQLNPIFGNKQDSTNMGIFSVYSYAHAFNVKPLTFSVIAGYNQKDSDITFHNENGLIVSTGLAYTF